MTDLVGTARLFEIESELDDLTTIVTRCFRRAGELLAEIRDGKLYRDAGYSNFEAYVQKRWHMTRRHAYHLVNAAIAVTEMEGDFPQEELPQNESVVRPLVPLDRAGRSEVWASVPPNPQRKDVANLVNAHKIVGVYPLIGSKWKLSREIATRAREINFEKYLEPFVGSGAVFFRLVEEGLIKSKNPAVLNDLNKLAIALFHVISEQPLEFQKRLMLVPNARVERSQPQPIDDAEEIDLAIWWAVRTYQGYVGYDTKNVGWSVDHSGNANRHEKWNHFKQQIPAMGQVLCEFATLECMDGLDFIHKYTRRSERNLLYVDPPYFSHEETYKATFAEHSRLAELLTEVPAAGVFVTYYDCEELRQLYSESHWQWELFPLQKKTEVLLTRKSATVHSLSPTAPALNCRNSPPSDNSKIESLAAQIKSKYQPKEVQQLISLLQS